MAPENTASAIELLGIEKRFGQVHANKDINLVVEKGTIHGIVGENGAGKSTLMSILYGFYQADSGEIRIDGQVANIDEPKTAIQAGIGMVHQHFMLVDNFTVLENVVLGAEGGMTLGMGFQAARQELQKLGEEYDLKVNPDKLVEDLPVGVQQRVEILKALIRGARILILDEPTSVLTPAEANHLFRILKVLSDQGTTILLITHKLREIMDITDTVSVMRQGSIVATKKTVDTESGELAELMVGRRVLLEVDKPPAELGDALLSVKNLSIKDDRGVEVVKNVSLDVHAGEIVGIAGVSGNGQSELLAAISGIEHADSGTLAIGGKSIDMSKSVGPSKMRHLWLGHVPEDRHRMGLVTAFPEYENSILGYHDDSSYYISYLLNIDSIREDAKQQIEKYDIRPANCDLKTANFSGGNQQKVVLAREIERDPKVLLVGQPTRGVDIGAIEYIYKRIVELRNAGKGILLVSVELDEIRSLADRILVMFDGRIIGERKPDASEQELGLLMAGVTGEARVT